MIQKSDALRAMEKVSGNGKRIPFQIAFITADRSNWKKFQKLTDDQKKKSSLSIGGKLITHDKCILSGPRGKHVKNKKEVVKKHPHNSANRTRNIVFLPSGQIRKLHNSLIIQFNHEEVIY
jgi:hypothetical protein